MTADQPPDGAASRLSTSSSLSSSSSSLPPLAVPAAAGSPAPSSPPSPSALPPRPSLLSRLSLPRPPLHLPLRSRNRNVVDFHVRCDEPYRKYSAGDAVRGSVVVVAVRPLRITHLVISLHGYVRVLRDPTSVAKAQLVTALPPGGSSARAQYHGNGLATLFHDEQVLSGEGRLEPGKYEFGFDLVFPHKELPSSIDFERGTISYMITATLTRPTTIAPTSTCDRKVMLVQNIDIGMVAPPRPRTIFLEPISKRTRRRKSVAPDRSPAAGPDTATDVASEADSIAADDPARDGHVHSQPDARAPPVASDVRSEVSGESGRSACTAVSRADPAQVAPAGPAMTPAARQQVVDNKTITTTIELLRGACLPGDTVSVRITIQHIKRVKSLTGVIVTLFRQGKIDTSPPPSLFTDATKEESPRADKPDYPRSRTGLAGLSLSSTSSTSVFRKDLDQNAAPLIIDPATLQASVTVSVKVPDDAFPTIKGVPGDMITFKYQVEVVVDLGGRLASQLQGGQSSSSRHGPYGNGSSDQGAASYGPRRAANIADTAQLRREKGVISVSMETVVGTTDSSSIQKAARSREWKTVRITESDDEGEGARTGSSPSHAHLDGLPPNGHHSPLSDGYQLAPPAGHPRPPRRPSQPTYAQANGHDDDAAPSYVPRPQVPDPSTMTEKERIRQAEARLLPSQPFAAGPSAAEEENIYDAEDRPPPPRLEPNAPTGDDVEAGPSAPTEEELTAGRPTEDKQELERRRLMNEASAPPEFPDDMERRADGSSGDQAHDAEPSAPVLDDDDDDGGGGEYPGYGAGPGPSRGGSSRHAEPLPAYER